MAKADEAGFQSRGLEALAIVPIKVQPQLPCQHTYEGQGAGSAFAQYGRSSRRKMFTVTGPTP